VLMMVIIITKILFEIKSVLNLYVLI
jgi:hypothetical protein